MRCCILLLAGVLSASAATIWVEGESPSENRMNRHPWWYDQVKTNEFSGGAFISNFNDDKAGEAVYEFSAPVAGQYDLWVRANPLQARLSYSVNGAADQAVNLAANQRGQVNVAADNKPDLRFLAWSLAGKVSLNAGANRLRFRMTSELHNHGYLDCFVLSNEPFEPRGVLKPHQLAAEMRQLTEESRLWHPFDPARDDFRPTPLDLRRLNEAFAGEHGFIRATNGGFVHAASGDPVRFWAVNGPPHELQGEDLRRCARSLAKRGVNLVRLHGGLFDEKGEARPAAVQHALEVVQVMKEQGIYSHFSIYFPLWLRPQPGTTWLEGYDGQKNPFAALLFNGAFQAQYRKWWVALLTTPDPRTGKRLIDEPAVFGLEIQNEDSFFFWTFDAKNLPEPQLNLLEKMFGDWLVKRHGSLEKALAAWKGTTEKRDAPAEGRIAFRPLWAMFNQKTARDQDTVRFLHELQSRFYSETYAFLRKLGFKGLITASNWSTASPEVFGPLEKWSYTATDFTDRHGYFSCNHKGDNAAWSIRVGHTYSDRSAYRFDPEEPGKPRLFTHPAMDPHYDGKPSMISEIAWPRPNRYRAEAPLYLAAYGALQGSDAIVQFALDGAGWNVKPNFWMQPWTMMSPCTMGQFPAAAMIYRRALIQPGKVVADVKLNKEALLRLEGTPLPQEAALDELRLADVPAGAQPKPGQRLSPLLHFVGRSQVSFVDGPGAVRVDDLAPWVDEKARQVTSATGELKLDFAKGTLTFNAPAAQGISGALDAAGKVQTRDLVFESGMNPGHILVVALDGQPIATSRQMLVQVMSEERPSGFAAEATGLASWRIADIGHDPWMTREFQGTVRFLRSDAVQLKVQALDANGYPVQPAGTAADLRLQPSVVYYLVER